MQPRQNQEADTVDSSLLLQSVDAFYRNLPALLKEQPRQWVAYYGSECVGFAPTETELYEKCRQRGLKEEAFVVLFADESALHDHEEINLPCNP